MFLVLLAIVAVACIGRGSRRRMFRDWGEEPGDRFGEPRSRPPSRIEERFAEWHRKTHERDRAKESDTDREHTDHV